MGEGRGVSAALLIADSPIYIASLGVKKKYSRAGLNTMCVYQNFFYLFLFMQVEQGRSRSTDGHTGAGTF